ncbi:hypothetical protein BD560DRAFT_428291 [Blakeslea trispora]|nr:hypothetical protein BD560DRAFT_428291 [Blakeslea trispora]
MMSNNCPDDYLLDTLPGLSYKSQASVSSFELFINRFITLALPLDSTPLSLSLVSCYMVSTVLVAKLQLAFASVLASQPSFLPFPARLLRAFSAKYSAYPCNRCLPFSLII